MYAVGLQQGADLPQELLGAAARGHAVLYVTISYHVIV